MSILGALIVLILGVEKLRVLDVDGPLSKAILPLISFIVLFLVVVSDKVCLEPPTNVEILLRDCFFVLHTTSSSVYENGGCLTTAFFCILSGVLIVTSDPDFSGDETSTTLLSGIFTTKLLFE